MNLYRLDFEAPDGRLDPVTSWVGDYLTRHYAEARTDALTLANDSGRVVRITRIGPSGHLTPIAHASGETHRIHRIRKELQ